MCFKKIKALFHRGETKPAQGRKPKLKEPERRILTGRGGLNMPKYQPCPSSHNKGSKRENKTMGGANYNCKKHGPFFVKAS